MKVAKWRWQDDEGGMDFIQLVVGLLIISIAAVGTLQSLYYGYEQLDFNMRYRKAVSMARSYAEYWQGRIHIDFPNPTDNDYRRTVAGNLGSPLRDIVLDKRDPYDDSDDIYCRLMYSPLIPTDLETTGAGTDFWAIEVRVEWEEPLDRNNRFYTESIVFYATMVPANL